MACNKSVIFIATILIICFMFWYYFIDTLMLTDITGKPSNPVAGLFVNLIDFDTGLTRYDIHNLAQRSDYWQRRIIEVSSIPGKDKRNTENTKLVAEMMSDPSVSKLASKVTKFGTESILSILQTSK